VYRRSNLTFVETLSLYEFAKIVQRKTLFDELSEQKCKQ